MTTELVETFDAWLDEAEAHVVRLDAVGVQRLLKDAPGWIERFAAPHVTHAERLHAHARITHYRDLCNFLQRSLHGAIMAAAGAPGAGYDSDAPGHTRPVLERYG